MAGERISHAEQAIDTLLGLAHSATADELPGLVAEQAAAFGVSDARIYLADLQQHELILFTTRPLPDDTALSIDGTVGGRCYQLIEVLTQSLDDGATRVWVPLVDGTQRLGVLTAVITAADAGELADGPFGIRLRRFSALVAELVVTKSSYGDTIARLRRRRAMHVAAELQWSLLPPLTFSTDAATIAGALEPAYDIAGDTLDYAVDGDVVRAAVFDGMGHGMRSAQLATVAVAAYRNQRRAGASLSATAAAVHEAMVMAFGDGQFTTAVFAELSVDTGRLRLANAGHPPPLLLRDGRVVRTLTARPVPPLGLALPGHERPDVDVLDAQLEPGDRVLLYTDGVLEARSPDGEFFGEQRLVDLLGRHFAAGLPTPETLRRVVHALLEHQQGRLVDDATMLLLEWRTSVTALRY